MGMLHAFLPIWLLATAGYAARRLRLLNDTVLAIVGWFVIYLAMPAAIFHRLEKAPLSGFDASELGAFAASLVAAIGIGWLCAGGFFDRKPGERVVWGMASGYGNAANLGIPVALQVTGNISFIVEVLLLQTVVVAPILLATLDRHANTGTGIRLGRVATLPFRNPVILGSTLGLVASAVGFNPPSVVQGPLTLLSATAVPAALILLGASLYQGDTAINVGRAAIAAIT